MEITPAMAAAIAAQPVRLEVPARVEGRELHIDGDYAAYYCSGNDETSQGLARRNCVERFESMATASGATKIIVHLTASGSHKGLRYFAATIKPYQAQRKGSRKPKNWQYLRDFLEGYEGERFKVKIWVNREADDGIAACAYHYAKQGNPIVIATRDKDMRMLPGIHQDWVSMSIDAVVPLDCYSLQGEHTDLQYGYKWLLLQCLHGDTADHIPGLEKIKWLGKNPVLCGEATAAKWLVEYDDSLEDCWAAVEEAYGSYYEEAWAERMAEQLSLLYLRHDFTARVDSWTLNPALAAVADPALILAARQLHHRCVTANEELTNAINQG